jgi:hypothetical protein
LEDILLTPPLDGLWRRRLYFKQKEVMAEELSPIESRNIIQKEVSDVQNLSC